MREPVPVEGGPYRAMPTATALTVPRRVPPEIRRELLVGRLPSKAATWALIAYIWPWLLVLGPFVLAFRFQRGRRHLRLLERGLVADGILIRELTTPTWVRANRVYELTIDFPDQRGRTHRLVVATAQHERLRALGRYRIIYDPADPRRAALLDELPGSPDVEPDGTLRYPARP